MGIAWTLECLGSARAGSAADALVERPQIANIASAVTFLRGHGDADTSHVDALGEALVEITDPVEADGTLGHLRSRAKRHRRLRRRRWAWMTSAQPDW